VIFQETAISVLASIAASGALSGLLIWLSREWISTRLKASIQHEYDQKLESLKSQLKAQSDVALVELRASVERHAALLAAAHSSFAEGQKAAMERKLNAVDTLWERLLRLRANLPPILGFIDVLTVDEYTGIKNHPTFEALSRGWSMEKITQLMDTEVERVRPYVGEYTWAVFSSYQAVMLRIVLLLHAGRDDAVKLEWHKDSRTRQLIEAVLPAAELAEFDTTRFGKVSWLQRRLESRILAATRKVVSGEEFSADALDQARLIPQRAAQIQTATA
jgi:hypothetical protein